MTYLLHLCYPKIEVPPFPELALPSPNSPSRLRIKLHIRYHADPSYIRSWCIARRLPQTKAADMRATIYLNLKDGDPHPAWFSISL